MMRSNVRTETLSCDGLPVHEVESSAETAFEKQRGVSRLERRDGFCQVHISDLTPPLMDNRIAILRAVADAQVSIDFLKLTPSGLSFLAPQSDGTTIEGVLKNAGVQYSLRNDRSIVMVHAVNIRDEEGLIAEIVQSAIASGAQIDHIGDGHDRLLLVAGPDSAAKILGHFHETVGRNAKRDPRLSRSA
jgi:aspartokinase